MTQPIVLIVAMESERHHLDSLLPGWEDVESATWLTRQNGNLICITSGIGMSLAAAATEYAISTYSPAAVLNFGCAGAHDREFFPGDVVIGDRIVHHGQLRFAPDGTIVPIDQGFQVAGEDTRASHLETDLVLLEALRKTSGEVNLPAWPEDIRLEGQPDRAPVVRIGTVSSGDIWLQDTALMDAAHERTGSLCEDMEAAAIAQICAIHNVPFATVKDISNSEFHEATTFEGATSSLPSDEVGRRAAMIVANFLNSVQ